MTQSTTNLVGKLFGNLTVLNRDPTDKHRWNCVCSCWNPVTAYRAELTAGVIQCCPACDPVNGPKFQRESIIRLMWLDGKPVDKIAKHAKCHTSTVARIAKELDLPPRIARPRHDEALVAKVLALWADGLTGAEIRMHYPNLSRNAIIGIVHRAGLKRPQVKRAPTPRPKASPTRSDIIKALLPVEPFVPEPDDPPLVMSVDSLDKHHCRWPIGDPGDELFGFCGKDKHHPRLSYCKNHMLRSLPPPPTPKQPAANDPQPRRPVLVAAD